MLTQHPLFLPVPRQYVANMSASFLAFDPASLPAGISTTSSASTSPSILASVPASDSPSVSASASLTQSAFKSPSDPPKVPAFASARVSTNLWSIASALRSPWGRQMCRLVFPLVCQPMCRPVDRGPHNLDVCQVSLPPPLLPS